MRGELEKLAAAATALGIRTISFGVHADATRAISEMEGALKRVSVYTGDSRGSFAIDHASITIAGVEFSAQDRSRPATEAELAGDDWHEHPGKSRTL